MRYIRTDPGAKTFGKEVISECNWCLLDKIEHSIKVTVRFRQYVQYDGLKIINTTRKESKDQDNDYKQKNP